VAAVMLTWRITGRQSNHRQRRGQYLQDDRFHAKRVKGHNNGGLHRDPALREERKRRAEAREEANRHEYQERQQHHEEENKDETESAAGGIFNAFFHSNPVGKARTKLKDAIKALDQRIVNNENRGIRWINMQLIPPLKTEGKSHSVVTSVMNQKAKDHTGTKPFFKAKRRKPMAWEEHDLETIHDPMHDNYIDYTKHAYEYPEKLMAPPDNLGEYPKLMTLKEVMEIWPQDALDNPPSPLHEDLIHFDFNNPQDMEAAEKFRDAALPFKVTNVKEVVEAGAKWTDEYVANHFDATFQYHGVPKSEGVAQESVDNYFAWYQAGAWDVDTMGIPPTRNNDFSFNKWAQHARYADRVGLDANQPHYYWQSGIDKEERYKNEEQWTFVSRDLPSFSSTEENFFLFEADQQKGIQCRFGERGVTAATHFDGGRNMVAMMTGAKRYILSPPKECGKLGIVTARGNPIFRHSLLNFGHLNQMDNQTMPQEERDWLELAGTAQALSTILKAGEVLYIPSHWFHYITSVQKSAQCNVRSGIDREGDSHFGGYDDVTYACSPGEGGM
ncbi:MAG: hypothetical protein SGILL_003183, partial [Bacillariaceae sp.]